MTITVTPLNSVSGTGTAAQTRASGSFAPTASSRVLVFVEYFFDGGTALSAPIISANTITGWTTTLALTAVSARIAIGFEPFFAVFEGVMGPSPSAGTFTIDFDSASANAYYSAFQTISLTGTVALPTLKQALAGPQVVNNGGGNSETHTTASLGSPATTGNTCIVSFGVSNDATPAPATPAGWTPVGTPTVSTPTAIGVWTRTDFTGQMVVSGDLGEIVDTSGSVLMEYEEVGGGGAPSLMFLRPTRSTVIST